jgi:hypothetical protein
MSAYWGKADMPPSRQAPRICYCVSQNATGNDQLEHVPPRLNRGILMRRRMGESIVIDSLLGAGQCRGLIPETCVSE